ncbi:MAG: ArsR/SmtB family transcription factor [Fusobacteriaceae bacterium]
MDKQLEILKALAHPVRLNVIYALKDSKTHCVCELQEMWDTSQSSLSQHLKILRDAGIVKSEKIGGWVHYSLSNNDILKILNELKEMKL